ncbi:MAG: TlpA disulfide reductase family protein [Candidatus Pedobacter colombiensis]|uniref:TlpA disulfide reductase family protein n=1 Tax=Candidatus Pedobacter colombiensis TaxID=3121371 RepID=A0AAJ5WDS7_9SPHI|nr:TlpA disulfide reductase family protein [Pedobacter sp.]WEK21629.1 MAG: TlpA disulfide reductase family protein [Pedobacter sp.]
MKRLLFFSLAALLSLPGFAQKNDLSDFSIAGKITGKRTGFVYLFYPVGEGFKADSAAIRNGTFLFKGRLAEPVMGHVAAARNIRDNDDPNTAEIFIGPGKMNLTVTYGAFKKVVLKGSLSNDEYAELTLEKESIRKEMEPLSRAYRNEKDHEKAAAIKEQFGPFNARMDKIDWTFINTHPDSYVSAFLMRFKMGSLSIADAKAIYNAWTEKIRNSTSGKEIYREITELESGSPGSTAKVFSATDINGEKLSLSDFKGKKYVLIDFWASWCVPCRKGNPHLLSLYGKYKGKGLEIIGVAGDDSNPEAWKKAVEKDQIGVWKHVLSGLKMTDKGFDSSNDITKGYGIHSLPTKILIDKEGIIIGRYGGGGENDEAMDKKMAEIFK